MKNQIIHPEEQQDLKYWANKWGISVRQLNLAIIDTGSVNTQNLRTYLKAKGFFSLRWSLERIMNKFFFRKTVA